MKKFELIYSILSNTATDEERKLFAQLIKSEEGAKLYAELKKLWNESNEIKNYQKPDVLQSFYRMNEKIKIRNRNRRRILVSAVSGIAAGVIILLGIINFVGLPTVLSEGQSLVQFQTETGNKSAVDLPDGTKVWLNSKSQLQYASDYNSKFRKIMLDGEAYFDVQKSKKPFIVQVNEFKIKVYGTKFNVSAYKDDIAITTSLESGKISITHKDSKEYFVDPGELVVYNKQSQSLSKKKVNASEYSAWRSNKLYLHNEPLKNLTKKLERKYGVNINFAPANMADEIHYSGVFSNESLDEVVEAITLASGLKYKKQGSNYIITQ